MRWTPCRARWALQRRAPSPTPQLPLRDKVRTMQGITLSCPAWRPAAARHFRSGQRVFTLVHIAAKFVQARSPRQRQPWRLRSKAAARRPWLTQQGAR